MFNLLKKNSIGLDIADHTIEVADLEKNGDNIKVKGLGRIKLNPGIVELGRIKNEERLLEAVKKVFKTAQPQAIVDKEIVFGLPDSQVYTSVFTLKSENDEDREQLIFEQAVKNIPLAEDDLVYSYKIIGREKEGEKIILVATSKEVVLEWQNFFKKAGLEVEIFDVEILAVFRGLFSKPPEQPACLIDIGSRSTNIAIFNKKGLLYSYVVLKGGDYFTENIAKTLEITTEKAEEEKLKADLAEDNQVSTILKKTLEPILEEIESSFKYFKSQNKEEKNKRGEGEVVLVGGSSQIKGLADYLSTNLKIKVRIGGSSPNLVYLEAVGLALRNLDDKWEKKDPAIETVEEEGKSGKKSKKKKRTLPEVGNVDNVLDPSEIVNSLKLKKQKKILLLILLFGIILIGVVFLYKSFQSSQKEISPEETLQEFQFSKAISVQVPVAVETREYSPDRIRGKIITNENEKTDEETLIKTSSENEWLVYSTSDAQSLFVVETKNKIKVDFLLQNIEYQNIEETENSAIYILKGKVNILTNQEIKDEEVLQTDTATDTIKLNEDVVLENLVTEDVKEEKRDQVLIKSTPTGWLNTRSGPGTTFSIVSKVYPGEKYFVEEDKSEWIKIELSENEHAWGFSEYLEYVEKVE